MIRFPTSVPEAVTAAGVFRSGATDLQERLHNGLVEGDIVDLRDLDGLDAIGLVDGRLQIGARVRIAELAAYPGASVWHGLVEAAGGLATPQIRNRATVAGNLVQEVRCWYYRNPRLRCAKKGGARCLARSGDALYHALYDTGPCIAPHPSTLAVALWAYDATIGLDGDESRDIPGLLGKGSDPTKTHALPEHRLVTRIEVPMPPVGEGGAYLRTIARSRSEWPLVEAVARCVRSGDHIVRARIVVGGVANRPMRLDALEEALRGARPADVHDLVVQHTSESDILAQTAYKVPILRATVEDTLRRAWTRAGSTP